eukprot:scaffold11522_cov239-Ochromonas_danica.AAC.3
MLADISGFSKFSGAMCQKGVSGLDDLREATNVFLGALVKTVYEFQGDVVAFAGDALICVFLDSPENDDDEQGFEEEKANSEHRSACYRAIECACVLRAHKEKKTSQLSAHIGVSYGEMKIAFLGGLHDQWVYLLNGACVSELAGCIEDAGPQQVVVTQACYNQALHYSNTDVVDRSVSGRLSDTGESSSKGAIRARNISSVASLSVIDSTIDEEKALELPPIITKPCAGSGRLLIERIEDRGGATRSSKSRKMSLMMKKQTSRVISMDGQTESHNIIEAAALFVPRPVLAAVYSESLEHIAELHQDPSSLQPFFLMAQQVLFEAGGFLRQFLVDDKGCVLIAMWGMPSFTYANNCSRALFCAVSIRSKAMLLEHKCSIGITTGNVFCGNVGAVERRDYAGIGNEVNLAARLMSKAKGRILADTTTYKNLAASIQNLFNHAEEMKLKGMDKPVIPFEYASDSIPRVAALDENQGYNTILRRQVKSVLSAQMDRIANADNVSTAGEKSVFFTVILGMPGTGKSTAAEFFRHGMRKRNIPCILILARPGHEGVPYGVMRELFLELVGVDNFMEEEQQRQQIQRLIDEAYPDTEEDDKNRARSIIEMVLGVEWSEANKANMQANSDDQELSRNSTSMDSHKSGSRTPGGSRMVTSPRDLRKTALTQGVTSSEHIENLGSSGMLGTNGSTKESLMDELAGSNTFTRPEGDLTFYKILTVLLKGEKVAIIIEDAHYCDELSWNELHLLLIGTDLNAVVLLTMRSSATVKPPIGDSPKVDHRGGRKSVLISQNEVLELEHNSNNTGHENSTVVEMNSLNEPEVKDILLHTLQVQDISNDLVKLVLDVSSGNAFWCKSIAFFIKERGAEAFEKAAEHESRVNSLKQLILLRMEKLDVDHQLILKYASIIGDEFSEKMLKKVLPERLWPKLNETMEMLAEHGFVLCIAESPQLVFGFQNDLIRQTIYELTPPKDAASVHLTIAEFIEVEYAKNLRPFYPILSAHYQKVISKRQAAFKYAVKAADQAVSRGAFGDGLRFAQIASTMAINKAELKVLLLVISRALHDIGPTVSLAQTNRRQSITSSNKSPHRLLPTGPGAGISAAANSRVSAYLQLKVNTEAALDKISRNVSVKPEEAATGNKNRLVISKQPSARLNWQPSYVASKLNDDDDSDDDDEDNRSVKNRSSGWCIVT